MEDFEFNDSVRRTLFDQSIRIELLEKENAELRELLGEYVKFAEWYCDGHVLQFSYSDGMGKPLDEYKMRMRAKELGAKEVR